MAAALLDINSQVVADWLATCPVCEEHEVRCTCVRRSVAREIGRRLVNADESWRRKNKEDAR